MKLLIEPFRKYVNHYCFTAIFSLRVVTLLFTLLTSYFYAEAQLPMGENPGYYGAQYTDQQLYDLMYAGGARSTRSSVSVQYDLQYGMATFQARLQYPYSTKGMRNNTFFLFASAGPTYSTESTKKTAGGNQSWLPTGIYNPAFNADGSINTANAWAKYVYDIMQSVGPYFTYYEVWNEPDLTSSSDSYNDSTVSKTSWQVREPAPDELLNMYDSLESYVQLCKIANQVVKKYQPNAKICTGGIGYQWFYQWFLRKGGGQWVDELSFHEYPYYDWCYCAWTGSTCGPAGFHRNSDYAANQVLAEFQDLRQIETNEKATHLPAMMTETNIPRWSYVPAGDMELFPQNRPWGTDRTQRNFTIKSFTKMMLGGLNMFYFYQTGETADSGLNNGSTGSEIDAMGMYKNLDKATPGKEVFTTHGTSIKTMQTLIGNYKVDATQPSFASGIDGVRFDSSGNKIYVIWAVTTLDTSETASASYTLPSGIIFKKYLYDGSSPGTTSGTIALTGDPFILVQNVSSSVNCNAGTNQTITLPTNTAILDASGSTVTNSTISSYSWTQISGSNSATISNAKSVTTTANIIIAGSYTFQVAIKDANGDSCASTVQITVKPLLTPPTVSAGSDQTITLPNSASLAGTASDATGTITTYAWTEISGPSTANISSANTLSASAGNLAAGPYVFKLTVTDNNNLFASATVNVTVNPANQPPVVSAGSNQTITLPSNTASLNGSATDATGIITTYTWTEISGPAINISNADMLNATANNLIAGPYVFQLTVTDNNNLSSSATVNITVNPPNQPPVVSAGSNQTIVLPLNSASLAGTASDATGNISTYAWTEISGPTTINISNADKINASVKNLAAGTYTFQLTVTDNNNLSSSATVSIIVNQLPVVDAGSDQTIILPISFASLVGTASDATGNINNYSWTQVSGPPNATISNADMINATVNNLIVGVYVFQLTVTDDNNLSASSTVTITVNQPLVVDAGSDQTITLPTNFVSLTGNATDAFGNISNYLWSEVSGPSNINTQDLSENNITVNNLVAGVYVFQLTVTDDNNLSVSATVTITVNQLPVVSTGSDQTIVLPNTVTLSGTATDATGTITTYAWTEISGPNNVSITNADKISATTKNLIGGIYVFQLTVTDNNNLSASATVTITANQLPDVDAGTDQIITLPTNTATLTGTVSDVTGNITNYLWTEVSGPNTIDLSDQDLGMIINNLVAGVYIFELSATDDNNLSASATIMITVNNANQPPVVSAGSNQTITLPATASLVGNATDAGTITNYAWIEISGPNNATISNANRSSATASNLAPGPYVFKLTVTDNNNLSSSATVNVTANQLPVVNAGSDQTITLPANTATLTGTASDATGTITTYSWSEVSGPDNNATFTNGNTLSATANNLAAGTYVFQLKVTDNNNLSDTATVTVLVKRANQLPVVSAGSNQTITLPANSATLTGTATDATGTITTYAWIEVSGPSTITITNATKISANVSGLASGSYVFQLTVTDNNNLSASATVTIAVNQLPVVSAGTNQTISLPTNTATLTGTASDATGTITTYAWTEVSGPSTISITTANKISASVSGLVAGSYVFQLTVTDNNNLSSSATVTIKVNGLPVVSAGSTQTISLPTNSATLTGTATDATGTITTYAWTEVSGPSTITITNANKISASVSGLVAGSYVFQLMVTDNNNLSASATVTIKVNALPVVSAGSNQTINLPTNTATLTGTATDATGTITTYAWIEVSGPSTITITNANKISASVGSLIAGSYVFQLKVTDNNSLSASGTVTIKVNGLPVVSAGSTQTINLPTNTATLTGTATDTYGTITTYAWTEVSGPSTITITNASKISASVGSLVAGSYVFQLTVTDNNNQSASASVTIKVNALPVVSAGSNQTIALPTNTATLTGTATDATGTITTYAWTEVSGPSTITITNATKISASVANLVAGSYVFQLKVTDNNSLSASATVTIKVNALPVVSAGSNQTINLPTSTATLTGTATDATGTITTYAWTEVSGPSTITITNATKISASVTSLVAGAYVFKLTVTDNNSLSASATVTITLVNPPPVVSAGTNQTINLPTSTATLTGTATDATGTITAYAWTQVSGPGTATITNGTKISASVSKLVAGTYVFQLKVTDSHSLTASATVTITVVNPPPVVSAGSNQTINLPTTTATLTGTATDATGTITAYAWTQVSGPNTATITNATKVSASLSKLIAGTYVFQLKVTDSHSLTATATVTIIVNQPPVANAGTNQTITLPTSKATLSGSKSTDADGTIASYSWTRVSGPSTPAITGNKTVTATISALVAGTYVYQLTVTDNRGATASATTQILVNAAKTGSVIDVQTVTVEIATPDTDTTDVPVADKILLFPNPARSMVNIQLTTFATGTMGITIYDMFGRQVLLMQTDKTTNYFNGAFDISRLSSGVYIMQILIGESKRMIVKFVKQ